MIPEEIRKLKPLTGKERLGAARDSEYMGAEDIDPDAEPVLTIQNIYNGIVTLSRGKERKDVMVFQEESVPGIKVVRPLIVNATNRKTLRKLFKAVTADALCGKKIRLYLEHNVRDPSTGDKVDGIRIRPTAPTQAAPVHVKCESCGKVIAGMGAFTAEQIADNAMKKYGKKLCVECSKKAKEEADKAAEEANKAAQEAEQNSTADSESQTNDDVLAALKA